MRIFWSCFQKTQALKIQTWDLVVKKNDISDISYNHIIYHIIIYMIIYNVWMLTLIEPTNMGSWGSTDVKISGISNRQDLRIWWGQKTTGAWCLVVWPALHVFKCRYYIYI